MNINDLENVSVKRAVIPTSIQKMFDWSVDSSMTISADSTGGTRNGIRQDPADKVLYIGEDDVRKALANIEAAGGKTVLGRKVVPGVVTVGLFLDPSGNLLGLAEFGSYPTKAGQVN